MPGQDGPPAIVDLMALKEALARAPEPIELDLRRRALEAQADAVEEEIKRLEIGVCWTSFSDSMADPHRLLLVTNNLEARTAQGRMSHVFLVHGVFQHQREEQDGSFVYAYAGEVTAFDEADRRIRNLTHWRYALPE